MAIDVDWTGIATVPYRIFIPRTDMPIVQVSPEIRSLDVAQFKQDLGTLQADEEGIMWTDTFTHVGEVVLSGVTYARFVEIIAPYSVEFEDGQYTVIASGANHNIADVKVANQVSLVTQNSAGLINNPQPSVIAAEVWNTILTGATHNIQNSAGKILRQLGEQVIHDGTAQGNGNGANQIVLENAASAVDGTYDPALVAITDGTGAGQVRGILQYDGATRTATVDRNWKTQPDNTSQYVILGSAGGQHVNEGLAQGGTSNTITLNALASGVDDVYVNQEVFIRSGTGEDQVGLVTAYNGTTKVATVFGPTLNGDWAVTPDSTSAYVMLPTHNNVRVEHFTAYGGVVTVDVINGSAGSDYPFGTGEQPVNNLADALVIAAAHGIGRLKVVGTLPIGNGQDVSGYVLEGTNALGSVVSMAAGCITDGTSFENMTLTGVAGGPIFCERVALLNVSNIGSDTGPSAFDQCFLLNGTISMQAGLTTPGNVQFTDCVAGLNGGGYAILDANGTTTQFAFRTFRGSLEVRNLTGGQVVELGFAEGELLLAASCTSGTVKITGDVKATDNSVGLTVDQALLDIIYYAVQAMLGLR